MTTRKALIVGATGLIGGYPALNDTVVGTCIDSNTFSELDSEHNLEPSLISRCSIYSWFFGINLEFTKLQGYSFLIFLLPSATLFH